MQVKALSSFADRIENLIYDVAERSFFFKSLEGRNSWCFDAALAHDEPSLDIKAHAFDQDGLMALPEGAGEVGMREKRLEGLRYRVVRDKYVRARESAEGKEEVRCRPVNRHLPGAGTQWQTDICRMVGRRMATASDDRGDDCDTPPRTDPVTLGPER